MQAHWRVDAVEETDSSVSKEKSIKPQLIGNKEMRLVLGISYHYEHSLLRGRKLMIEDS